MKRHRLTRLTVAVLALTLLASCVPAADPGFASTEPSASRETLDRVDALTVTTPAEFEGRGIIDPGWITRGQQLGGVFVGPRAAASGHIEFVALDAHGEVLWSARRPPSCTGFLLTRQTGGRAVAVLTDVTVTPEAIAGTTASAYDLVSGEHLWGPVDVPGPLVGPGLVFASTPAAAIGQIGDPVPIDVETGTRLPHEGALIGEHRGKPIEVVPEWGWDATHAQNRGSALSADAPYMTIARGDSSIAVVHAETGDLVADHVSQAMVDEVTQTLVLVDGSTVTAMRDEVTIWQVRLDRSVVLMGVTAERVYMQEDGRLSARDMATGEAQNIKWVRPATRDTPVLLPRLMTREGAGIFTHHSAEYLVTAPSP